MLRRIFGVKRDEVTGEWRKLHNEGINDLYSLNNNVIKLRRIGGAGHVALLEVSRGVDRILVGKPEEKRPFGIPRRRWENNIEIELQEVECRGMDWVEMA